ncbi:MAG TPA: hypothetical protein DCF86_09535 [Dehalococcoidia bacterium]|nr:hypothetical protein [Dehalococcoidia bacterium]
MKLFIRAGFLTIFFLALLAGSGTVAADDRKDTSEHRLVILTLDMDSTVKESNVGVIKSLVGLLSTLRQNDDFYLSTMDSPETYYGPFRAGDQSFSSFNSALDMAITLHKKNTAVDVAGSVSEAYNLLGVENAPEGSTLYIVGSGEIPADGDYMARYMDPLSEMFAKNKWEISGLTLPDASESMVTVLDRISSKTGSVRIELSVDSGLKRLADEIMKSDSLGSLVSSGEGELSEGGTLTANIPVAPGTRNVLLIFFKESPSGSLRLNNPEGIESSSGDRTSSRVLETPHIVVWQLADPIPGNWSVDVKGMIGKVSSWHIASNKFRLNLSTDKIVPTGQPTSIVAYITDGDLMVSPGEEAYMTATVTTPNGTSVLYQLNDKGQQGDVVAADGYYSSTITPSGAGGDYNVSLELGWAKLTNTLTESASFKAQPFPSMMLTTLKTERLYPGQETIVANVFVNVAGEPFAIEPSALTFGIGQDSASAGSFKFVPRTLAADGQASMFDVLFTPFVDGITPVVLNLNLEYAGSPHNEVTDTLMLNTIRLPLPEPEEYTAPSQAVKEVISTVPVTEPSLRIPMGLIGIPIAVVALMLAALIYQRAQTRPFGHIYNEKGDPLIDFNSIKRSMIRKMLFPSIVRGSETGIQELKGITFKFKGNLVDIHSIRVSPTVRVDNQPVVGEITLNDQSWIGTHGRLFNFLKSTTGGAFVEPGYGDD